MNPAPTLAADKRTVDHDGRLRVRCHISKAAVNPYYGREIPGFEALRLDPDRVYMMYRDPEELRKAAATFDAIPLLNVHVPVTSDAHAPESTVGVISRPEFVYPYMDADVTVWTDDAKALIDSGEQRELSSAYRYEPEMRAGTSPEGLRYDGVMRHIMANHVALVGEGRAGPDVMVADSSKESPRMKFTKTLALLAKLFPVAPTAEQALALDTALAAEIEAMDADMSESDKKAACDSYAKELGKDAESMSDEERTEAFRRAAADKRAKDMGAPHAPQAPGIAPQRGMDEAAVKVTVDAAVAAAREGYIAQDAAATLATDAAASVHALYAARDAVAEKTGLVNLTEHNTAGAVYRYALDKLSVPHADVADAALPALYVAATKPAVAIAADVAPFNPRAFMPGLDFITRG